MQAAPIQCLAPGNGPNAPCNRRNWKDRIVRHALLGLVAMLCLGMPPALAAGPDWLTPLFNYKKPAPRWHSAPTRRRIPHPHPPPAPTQNSSASGKGSTTNPATSPVATAPPPYEPKLLRLSEMLGALAYLQDLCKHHSGDVWRTKMAALITAEAKTNVRKERLAGAFNRGFKGYALTYRLCTPNAQAIIGRFLKQTGALAQEVAHRYGPS